MFTRFETPIVAIYMSNACTVFHPSSKLEHIHFKKILELDLLCGFYEQQSSMVISTEALCTARGAIVHLSYIDR